MSTDSVYAWVDSSDTGHTVLVNGNIDGKPMAIGVAAFSHRDDVDAERWARDYASAINRAHEMESS